MLPLSAALKILPSSLKVESWSRHCQWKSWCFTCLAVTGLYDLTWWDSFSQWHGTVKRGPQTGWYRAKLQQALDAAWTWSVLPSCCKETGSRCVITWPEQSLMAKDPSTLVSKPTFFHSLRAEACQAGTAIMIKTPFLTSLLPLVRLVSLSCYKKRGNWDTEQDDNLSKAAQGSHKKPCSVPGRILFWVPTRDMKKTILWSAAGLRSSVRAHFFPEMVSRSKTGSQCLGGCFY